MRARISSESVDLGADLQHQRLPGLQQVAPVDEPLLVDGRLELAARVGQRDDADPPAVAGAPLLPLDDGRGEEAAQLPLAPEPLGERLPERSAARRQKVA